MYTSFIALHRQTCRIKPLAQMPRVRLTSTARNNTGANNGAKKKQGKRTICPAAQRGPDIRETAGTVSDCVYCRRRSRVIAFSRGWAHVDCMSAVGEHIHPPSSRVRRLHVLCIPMSGRTRPGKANPTHGDSVPHSCLGSTRHPYSSLLECGANFSHTGSADFGYHGRRVRGVLCRMARTDSLRA